MAGNGQGNCDLDLTVYPESLMRRLQMAFPAFAVLAYQTVRCAPVLKNTIFATRKRLFGQTVTVGPVCAIALSIPLVF